MGQTERQPGAAAGPASARAALIVGASGTLGDAVASALIARGFDVGLHAHQNRAVCEARAAQAQAAGRRAAVYAADIASFAACKDLAEGFLMDFGRLDALYLCAGVSRDSTLAHMTVENWDRVMGANVDGPFYLLRHFARTFARQRAGLVVAVGSYAGLVGRPAGACYAASKSALVGLVKSAAREFGPLGVRVLCVLPGFLRESAMGRAAGERFVAAARQANCLADFPSAGEVAAFMAGLVDAPAVSGQVFNLDARIIPAV